METKKPEKVALTEEQLGYIEEYCGDNMKKLKAMIDPIIVKIGGISEKDHHDLYSFAQLLLLKNVGKYDPNNKAKASFKTFFYVIFKKRLYQTYIRDRNRQCRSNTIVRERNGKKEYIFIPDISMESLPPDCVKYLEMLACQKKQLEDEFVEEEYSPKMQKYIARLSKVQFKILEAIANGDSDEEIKEKLHIDDAFYRNSLQAIHSNENVKILRKIR